MEIQANFRIRKKPFTCITVDDTDPKERPPKSESLTPFKATIGCVLASKSSLVLPHRVKLTLNNENNKCYFDFDVKCIQDEQIPQCW